MPTTCEHCHSRFALQSRQGRPKRFCSPTCRKAAQRAARRAVSIPVEMTRRNRWVRHDERKRPLTIHGWLASSTRPSTWTSYRAACASTVGTGLGFVLGDGIGCIDLDHCVDARTGEILPWAKKLLKTYRDRAFMVERSMSGTGIHIFLEVPEGKGWRRPHPEGGSIEVYSRDRYIAVTGDII